MRTARGLNVAIAFVEGEEKVADVDKRTLQRPRVFLGCGVTHTWWNTEFLLLDSGGLGPVAPRF